MERPEVTRSYVTPAVFEPQSGPAELIVPGAYQVTSYRADTGEKLWWVRGFSWQPKSLPVIDGDMIYVHGWEGGGEAETPTETPAWEEALGLYDKDKDGKITQDEVDPNMQKGFYMLDLDSKGYLTRRGTGTSTARAAPRATRSWPSNMAVAATSAKARLSGACRSFCLTFRRRYSIKAFCIW